MMWVLAKPLENMKLLKEFEEKNSIQFPKSYIEVVANYNYGRPRPNTFDTDQTKERIAKALLSFNKNHLENIWHTYDAVLKQLPADAYPFMIDQFGNYVCFYYDPLLDSPSIILFDLESQKVEKVADTFEQFLTVFYEL
ncbi:SMI1/KNR4 family protein [Priestia koreensis]|uniref:Knr4/Smi1-like domain-containing protein n=1 Tax=Priestia koreensis TaxID=284581 RepID=A0A0M0LBV7_9BACI|nr:SMI1/KNR4 family protein [Priestia koreensis]KOO48168.1 hypothetical protein AMD01_05015 [Priestia koreensis]